MKTTLFLLPLALAAGTLATGCAAPAQTRAIRAAADSGLIQGLDKSSTFAFGVPNYHSGAYCSVGKFNAKIEEGPHKDQNATFVLAKSRATRQWEVIRVLVDDNGQWKPLPVKEK